MYSENIGSSARACANFGIPNLIVVNPENPIEIEKAKAMATRVGEKVLDSMKIFSSLEEALKDFNYALGTTARLGRKRLVYFTPEEISKEICELSIKNRIAILFGNERMGLSNEELLFCEKVISIPTTENASLNVSQAVIIVLYEIFKQAASPVFPKPALAKKEELETCFKIIEATLEAIDYVPYENKTLWMTNIRRFLTKFELTSKEVKIIQGFCRNLLRTLGKDPNTLFQAKLRSQNDRSGETCQKE